MFFTKAYIQAALPDIRTLLVKAEETSDDVRNAVLRALVTENQALDKVQAAGEGEGLAAWRGL